MKYNKTLEKHWKIICNQFKPDLIHIHGTEYSHGLACINACPEIKSIVSIQGLVHRCAEVYFGGLSFTDVLKNITIRDMFKLDTLFNKKHQFNKRGINEIKLIKKADAIVGRTMWDYANVKKINNTIKYYLGNEILRNKFYNNIWKIENVEVHSIFCGQGTYPIKGLHFLIKAIYIVKKTYPDVKLYIAGTNIIDRTTFKNKLKETGYARYIYKLIKKLDLEDQIIFTGCLNQKEMIEKLLKTNIYILPSIIENSSNSLCEAMIMGMPCIATTSGGTMSLLKHEEEGYLYPYNEPALCAEYIKIFFNNVDDCISKGNAARKRALLRHDIQENVNNIIKIYEKQFVNTKEKSGESKN